MLSKMAEMVGAERLSRGLYWTRALSLVSGCTHCSPGCHKCWSAAATHMRAWNPNIKIARNNLGLTNPHGKFNGNIRLHPELINLPSVTKKPTVWAVWNDLFHVDIQYSFQALALSEMAYNKRHIFITCTKRADRMQSVISRFYKEAIANKLIPDEIIPIPNLITMITAENQDMADERIPYLLQTESACRAVSVEPLLSNIDFTAIPFGKDWGNEDMHYKALLGTDVEGIGHYSVVPKGYSNKINWITVGAETPVGPKSRKPEFDWIDNIHQQCHEAGVPIFMKNSLKPFYRHLPQEFPL